MTLVWIFPNHWIPLLPLLTPPAQTDLDPGRWGNPSLLGKQNTNYETPVLLLTALVLTQAPLKEKKQTTQKELWHCSSHMKSQNSFSQELMCILGIILGSSIYHWEEIQASGSWVPIDESQHQAPSSTRSRMSWILKLIHRKIKNCTLKTSTWAKITARLVSTYE